jgi:uncharacterized integral membrane protein
MRIRLLILLLVIGAAAIFIVQNQQPVSLKFFGQIQIQMPIALWALLFTAAGIFTSFCLQLLNLRPRRAISDRSDTGRPKPFSPSSPSFKTTSDYRQSQEVQRSPASNYTTAAQTDWAMENDDDEWNIEEPPAEPTPIPEDSIRQLGKDTKTNFETQQQPKTVSQRGSVYSHSYRESKNPRVGKTETVYDANYRVITPPYQEKTEQPQEKDDEEDWL